MSQCRPKRSSPARAFAFALPFTFAFALSVVLTLALPNRARALGSDHPSGPIANQPSWPTGMVALVNAPARFDGYWVNASDTFFYAGSQADFERFLQDYAKVTPTIAHRIVIHPGSGHVDRPWGKTPPAPADWKLIGINRSWARVKDTGPRGYDLEVHVWDQGRVRVPTNQLPRHVTVTSAPPATPPRSEPGSARP